MKKGIKSKSFRIIHRIVLSVASSFRVSTHNHNHSLTRTTREVSREFFSIFICLLFALFIIEKCFFLPSHCFVIATGFNFILNFPAPSSNLVFVSFHFFSPSSAAPILELHPTNIHTNIFHNPQTRYTKVISLLHPPLLLPLLLLLLLPLLCFEVFKFYFNVCTEH